MSVPRALVILADLFAIRTHALWFSCSQRLIPLRVNYQVFRHYKTPSYHP
jgi:hypothetical protein